MTDPTPTPSPNVSRMLARERRKQAKMRRRLTLAVELARGTPIAEAAARAGVSEAQARRMAREEATRVLVGAIRYEATVGYGAELTGVIGAVLKRHGIDPDEALAAVRERAAAEASADQTTNHPGASPGGGAVLRVPGGRPRDAG